MKAVEVEHLVKKFSNVTAIDDISLTAEAGKVIGLISANGAGKTTLLRLLTGLLKPTSGTVRVFGVDPLERAKRTANYSIGYMPQTTGLYEDLTVLENLRFYADLKKVPYDFDKLLEFTSLTSFQKRLVRDLSGGMKKKLSLACTFLGHPKLIILDEPDTGVDPVSRRDLMTMVKDLMTPETVVFWSSFYLDETYDFFDDVFVLNKGKLIFHGRPQEYAVTSDQFEEQIIQLMGGLAERQSDIGRDIPDSKAVPEKVVEVENLVKKYGDFYAVAPSSFQVRRGEVFGLLGSNGAGKSTCFKMLCGLTRPTAGTIKIMGKDIAEQGSEFRSQIGYQTQQFSLYGTMTVRKNLEFFAALYLGYDMAYKERVEKIIHSFNLATVADRPLSECSGGFKQRVSLAVAFLHYPKILFLDEPTSGVDYLNRRVVWRHLRAMAEKGITVLITTHSMNEAALCDRICLFHKGEIIALGSPEELQARAGTRTVGEAFIKLVQNTGAL